jgi:hypothetical protein
MLIGVQGPSETLLGATFTSVQPQIEVTVICT